MNPVAVTDNDGNPGWAFTHPVATAPFLVFADARGFAGPTYKHTNRKLAETEAQRLATLNPGINYYVLGSVSVTSATKPVPGTRNLV